MFPTFNGSSRKPRNVNLSGRKSAPPSRSLLLSRAAPAHSSSLLNAQHERANRENERQRLKATITIQRVWRGRTATAVQRARWRREWDSAFAGGPSAPWEHGIALFLGFYERGYGRRGRRSQGDLGRMRVLVRSVAANRPEGLGPRTRYLLGVFARLLIEALDEEAVRDDALRLLPWLAERLPALVDARYFQALSAVTAGKASPESVLAAVLTPLRRGELEAYTMFAAHYLTTPDLPECLGAGFAALRSGVSTAKLVHAMEASPGAWSGAPTEGRLWMLAYTIDFTTTDLTTDRSYIRVLSLLLSSVAREAGKRIGIEDVPMSVTDDDDDATETHQPLPEFVRARLAGLITQPSVSAVFSHTHSSDRPSARILAGFALTLLLVFPARRQEVRMWLCLAETADGTSAVRFLWEAVKRTSLFTGITKDYRIAVESLKRQTDDEEWGVIALFVELYGFLLMLMDDDEFFGGRGGRQLPLTEVSVMSAFLKNLAFAMFWCGGEILEDKGRGERGWDVPYLRGVVTALLRLIYTRDSRRRFLKKGSWLMTDRFNMEGFIPAVVAEEENRHNMESEPDSPDAEEPPERNLDLVAVAAMNPYERRNLRLERIKRNQRKQQRSNYLAAIAPRLEILQHLPFFIPFATRVQIFREFVLTDQKRRRGGFTDPDQWRAAVLSRSGHGTFPRHDGPLDGHDRLSQHHATIRRNRVFEDAYEQFWGLGEGLKEPIQITFVDRFGTEEAGIDGGGVTKEFLTGVCGEAFTPADTKDDSDDDSDTDTANKNLFLENDQHLLYPNPTSLDSLRDSLRTADPATIDKETKRLLRRYEFLGRIVGKCLYEGILVDVHFAGFFLLRWSSPSSSSSSSSSINDLRDLDEDLYRGLINLKNYNNDVETDFALNFTITSLLPSGTALTLELKPGGADIPVSRDNRLEYIHLVSRYRLSTQSAHQTAAFLKGLNSIIMPSWLNMFNQTELQTLVGGDTGTPIDVEDLRRNTVYGGVYVVGEDGREHESVVLFWRVMRELGDGERRKVLRFVTSVARAPLLGFAVLRPRFSIRDAGEDQTRLCSASKFPGGVWGRGCGVAGCGMKANGG